jgi:hypothetical protein
VINKDSNLNFTKQQFSGSGNEHILDILVENMGRLNFGHEINNQRKGLTGEVLIDEKVHKKWKIFLLEFKEKFIEGLKTEKWKPFENTKFSAIYRAVLDIKDKPKDTFMKLDNWTKTWYSSMNSMSEDWNIGPQYLLYIPMPFQKREK